MIKKEDIKKWVSERSKTINACLDLAGLNGEFDQMVSDIIHDCITELSQDKWVSVSESLPDDESVEGKILLLINGKYPMIGAYSDTAEKFAAYGGVVDEVTHWKPLPELPNDK